MSSILRTYFLCWLFPSTEASQVNDIFHLCGLQINRSLISKWVTPNTHFKLIGFPLSWTFLNIILSPSPRALWSATWTLFFWIEKGILIQAGCTHTKWRQESAIWQMAGERQTGREAAPTSNKTNSGKICIVREEILTETNASQGADSITGSPC